MRTAVLVRNGSPQSSPGVMEADCNSPLYSWPKCGRLRYPLGAPGLLCQNFNRRVDAFLYDLLESDTDLGNQTFASVGPPHSIPTPDALGPRRVKDPPVGGGGPRVVRS